MSSFQQNITRWDKTQEKNSLKREASARTRLGYEANVESIRELNKLTMINMLMVLVGKVGNMQEQIDNVNR